MALQKKQIRHLKAIAHSKKPVVTIGNKGTSDAVVQEIKTALEHHELIKVKLPQLAKTDKQEMVDHICDACDTDLVNVIGRIAILFSPSPTSSIVFPS